MINLIKFCNLICIYVLFLTDLILRKLLLRRFNKFLKFKSLRPKVVEIIKTQLLTSNSSSIVSSRLQNLKQTYPLYFIYKNCKASLNLDLQVQSDSEGSHPLGEGLRPLYPLPPTRAAAALLFLDFKNRYLLLLPKGMQPIYLFRVPYYFLSLLFFIYKKTSATAVKIN